MWILQVLDKSTSLRITCDFLGIGTWNDTSQLTSHCCAMRTRASIGASTTTSTIAARSTTSRADHQGVQARSQGHRLTRPRLRKPADSLCRKTVAPPPRRHCIPILNEHCKHGELCVIARSTSSTGRRHYERRRTTSLLGDKHQVMYRQVETSRLHRVQLANIDVGMLIHHRHCVFSC